MQPKKKPTGARAARKPKSDDALDHRADEPRPAQASGRKVHHPRGFRDEGGWILRVDGAADPFDAFVRVERERVAGRSADENAALAQIEAECARRILGAVQPRWWAVAVGIYLEIYARFPNARRRTPSEILALVRGMLGEVAPGRSLMPTTVTPALIAKHAGERLDRVAVGPRGGGRGRSARRSVAAIVDALVAEEHAGRASLGLRILNALRERRGVRGIDAIRRIVGGRSGPVRAAVADLERADLIENRGTEPHPIYFAGSQKSRSSRIG